MGNIRSKLANAREKWSCGIDVPARDQVFRNELLADLIIGQLCFSEILKMRVVCKLWKQTCLPHIIQRSPAANIDSLMRSFIHEYPDLKERRKQVARFVNNAIKSDDQITFAKIYVRLEQSDFYKDKKVTTLLYGKLFPLLAKSATELEIQCEYYLPLDWAVVEYPFLQILIIKSAESDNCKDIGKIVQNGKHIAKIVEKAPNLNSVNFYERAEPLFQHLFLDAVQKLPNTKVKHLSFSGNMGNRHVAAFQKLKQNSLLTLTLNNFYESRFNILAFNKIFYNQKNSLQELVLHLPEQISMTFDVPIMESLTLLEIYDGKNVVFSSFSIAKHFPSLKPLNLFDYYGTFDDLIKYPQAPCLTLEHLELSRHFGNHSILVKSAEVFPNIKTLKAPGYLLNENTIPLGWKNVDKLIVEKAFSELALVNMAQGTNRAFLAGLKYLAFRECHISPDFYNFVVPALESLECLDFFANRKITMDESMYWNMREKFDIEGWYPHIDRLLKLRKVLNNSMENQDEIV